MEILVIIVALAFVQVWGANNPLHKDGWYFGLQDRASRLNWFKPEFRSFVGVAFVLFLFAIVFDLLVAPIAGMQLVVAIIVLLYSLGRGEFAEIVREYTQACYIEDWDSAKVRAARFNVSLDGIRDEDWPQLHRHVFDEAGYRGFERLFAVLFWFFLLGPLGALMYRLVFLQVQRGREEDGIMQRWLWLLEWPAVRLLGLSFALTGNFSGCMGQWKECVLCVRRSTIEALSPMILGALSVSEELEPDCEITRKELSLMSKLYQRTFWFWLGVASLIVIFL